VAAELRVVATAGHVDHGKSSLIVRLTGIDPDRWAEEKRRGLTIDLGYAWATLPSGREVGFVDVPGHERFIANMLAGVGPVRLVLFVVAADEGWKPQSEEHLQILDVLGVAGGVVALTKRDLVDDETLAIAEDEVAERVAGTALEGAPIVPVSATTGEGIGDLVAALDAMLAGAPVPTTARARLFVDRVFSITGAGTVVTGTLEGDCLEVQDEVELQPAGVRARVRSLQTHKHKEDRACPVTRVAANLVGIDRDTVARGDALVHPGRWRPTRTIDALIRPVRGADAIPARGAFKLHAGAAEADARVRLATTPEGRTVARIALSRALTLDVGERFVLRESGRRATVGGGIVLDIAPVGAFTGDRTFAYLDRAAAADRVDLAGVVVAHRGAAPTDELTVTLGVRPPPELAVGAWCVDREVRRVSVGALTAGLASFHRAQPLADGMSLADARAVLADALVGAGAPRDLDLVDAVLDATEGVTRTATTVRLSTHRVALDDRAEEVARLVEAVSGDREPTPPSIQELIASGVDREVLEAAARAGRVVRITNDLVVAPALIDRALDLIRVRAEDGTTVSQLREHLGTSRKYAVPLVEWMDRQGLTRRRGDLRFPR
jgi:selenocysteine-specific elongation factor